MNKKNGKNASTGALISRLVLTVIVVLPVMIKAVGVSPLIPVVMLLIIGVTSAAVIRSVLKTKATESEAAEHSHDRLHPAAAEPCTDRFTHYKKQLDSFLANGIIDRKEYAFLLNKYRRELED